MYASTSILEGQMNNELIDALEALLEAAPRRRLAAGVGWAGDGEQGADVG
jgi:hypothetical protein